MWRVVGGWGCMHNHTHRTRLHPGVPGAPTDRGVSLSVSRKEIVHPALRHVWGPLVSPEAARLSFLQAFFFFASDANDSVVLQCVSRKQEVSVREESTVEGR